IPGSAAFHSTATRRNAGAISFRSSSRLGVISADTSEMPVTWPPGRARPSTNPVPTGSPVVNDTTGRVVPLSFPKIISGHIDDVAQPERESRRRCQSVGSAVRAGNLYSKPDAYAYDCSTRYRPKEFA